MVRSAWRGSRQTAARAESLFFAAIPTPIRPETPQEKYCLRPGLYCSLILLTSVENAERGVEVPRVPGLGADPEDDLIAQFRV
jgi:hypothetical protein